MSFVLRILTPDQTLYQGDAESLTIPTENGQITIRDGHAPLFATLAPGEGAYLSQGVKTDFLVHGGVVEIRPDHRTTLMADAESLESLPDETSIAHAIERARELMKRPAANDTAYAEASAHLARELLRYKVVIKRRRPSLGG